MQGASVAIEGVCNAIAPLVVTDPILSANPITVAAPPARTADQGPLVDRDLAPVVPALPLAGGRDFELAAERRALESARRDLGAGRFDAAVAALEQHAREHPDARLAPEREALWIQALVAAGRASDAKRRAADFLARYPNSALRSIVESSIRDLP